MKHRLRSLPAIIIVLLTACLVQLGCKENTLINSRLSPSSNTDSVYSILLPCITHTYYDDSTITSTNIGGIPVLQGVGAVVDPFFGTMTGATFFQVIPGLYTDTSGYSGYTVDSAVLVLPYSGFTYGSTATDSTATYQVFYMADTLSIYNTYYAFTNKPIDASFPLSAPTTLNIAHLDDSILVVGTNHSGLRIKLNQQVTMSHIMAALTASSGSSNPYQDFMNAFNGICVRSADNRHFIGAMPYFELDGTDAYSEAGIIVYGHPTGTTDTSSIIDNYYFNTGLCGHYNNIVKSYSHYPVNNLLHSAQPNDQVIALQNQPGPCIDVIIPNIKSLNKGIISKAEIQLTLLPQSNYNDTNAFIYPERVTPLGIATTTYMPLGTTYAGETYTVYDRYPLSYTSPLAVLDGLLHTMPNGTSTFTIDIPREVIASIAANNDTLRYHITGTQDDYGAFHMVAGGGNYGISGTSDTMYRAKVKIVYSKLSKIQ